MLGFLEALLVGDTFKLVTLLNKPSILGFYLALLLHDLGDLFAHHLRHFLAHVVLQHLQVVQLLDHLNESKKVKAVKIKLFSLKQCSLRNLSTAQKRSSATYIFKDDPDLVRLKGGHFTRTHFECGGAFVYVWTVAAGLSVCLTSLLSLKSLQKSITI